MARKNKKVEIQESETQQPEAQHDPVMPHLTELELLKLKLFEAEQRASTAEANLKISERNAYLRKIDPDGKLATYDKDIRNLIDKVSINKVKYNEVISSVESRVAIKMADYSYDDETGALVYIAG